MRILSKAAAFTLWTRNKESFEISLPVFIFDCWFSFKFTNFSQERLNSFLSLFLSSAANLFAVTSLKREIWPTLPIRLNPQKRFLNWIRTKTLSRLFRPTTTSLCSSLSTFKMVINGMSGSFVLIWIYLVLDMPLSSFSVLLALLRSVIDPDGPLELEKLLFIYF